MSLTLFRSRKTPKPVTFEEFLKAHPETTIGDLVGLTHEDIRTKRYTNWKAANRG